MKRVLTFILVLSMVLGSVGMVFADSANSTTYAEKAVAKMVELGFVEGDEGGLRLNDPIKRSEVAVISVRMAGLEDIAKSSNYKGIFSDVTPDMWDNPVMNGAINVAAGKGLVQGYPGGTFQPNSDITNAEAITLMVRLAVSAEEIAELDKGIWPAAYITKAVAMGLLEGTSIDNYQAAAKRETVFVLGYNANVKVVEEDYYIFKAIVLENDRVEKIGGDRVVVEVIREVQKAKFVEESREEKEKGDQLRLDLPEKYDVEDLLGKVIDISLDKYGKVAKIEVDKSYDYLTGKAVATKDKLEVGKTRYTVLLGERYDRDDERIFRTYLNDEAMRYEDFYRKYEGAEFARVTVKNGKVIFIDAFDFDDIAPVKDVRRDGLDVYVYNDYRDAREEKFEPKAWVIGYNNGKFSKIDRKDIAINDVVHVYNKSRLIVRQDALKEGAYTKVERDKDNDYFAHVGDGKYKINDVDYRRPVYAHDSKAYTTLYTRNAQVDLKDFYKEEVVILIDIKGDLQLFGADIEYNEGMAIVEQILARGQGKFVQPNNEKLVLDETYDSKISTYKLDDKKTTTNQRLNRFDKRDLVFVKGDGKDIDTLVRIASENEMIDALQELASTKSDDMNNDFIRVKRTNGNYRYQVLDRTNVFVIGPEDKDIEGTTVKALQGSLKKDTDIKVFVLTDKEVSGLIRDRVITDRHRITDEANVAHTLVFFNPEYDSKVDGETVLVTNVYTARKPHYVIGQRPDNVGKNEVERTAEKDTNLETLRIDDIVSLKLTKDDDKLIKRWDVLISTDKVKTDSYKVVGGDIGSEYSRYEYRRLVLEDAKGVKYTYWLIRNVEEYGTITLDSVVTFHLDKNSDIDVIRVYKKGTRVTANQGQLPDPDVVIYNGVYELDGNVYIRLGNKTYPFVGGLPAGIKVGDGVKATIIIIRNEEVVERIVVVGGEDPGVDKTVLKAKVAEANALDEEDYTAESWAVLEAALAKPESTQAQVDAKVAAISAAIAGLVEIEEEPGELEWVESPRWKLVRLEGKLNIPAGLKGKVVVKVNGKTVDLQEDGSFRAGQDGFVATVTVEVEGVVQEGLTVKNIPTI